MTDLDALRRALHEPPAEQFAALDVDKIMTSGRRIRRRRRAVVGAGAVLATAAVLIGVTIVVRAPAPSPPADPPLPTVSDVQPMPKVPRLGDIVRTGVQQPKGELVFFFSEVNAPELPNVHFAVNSGWLTPSGDLISGISNNEISRAGKAPGFHPIMGGHRELGSFTPAFGYFVGPVARIEARVLGKTVRPPFTVWSEDRNVAVFWFPEEMLPDAELLGQPTAYDAQGKRLN